MGECEGAILGPLFSSSIIWYLFLGGAGSGAYVIASIVGLLRGGGGMRTGGPSARLVNAGRSAGFFITLFGVVFLVLDLGRIDRAYLLFIHPTFSMASIGAYVILLFLASTAYLMALQHLGLQELTHIVTQVVTWASVIFGVAVMTYTGLLLQSLSTVSFWASLLVPVLFVLSSLSSGMAILLLCGFVLGPERAMLPFLRRISHADGAIAAIEAIVLAVFVLYMRADTSALASVELLLEDRYAEAFWAGYVLCGLVAPLLGQVFVNRKTQVRFFGALGVALLVGGFYLRYCIVNAGVHDALARSFGI